MAKLEKSQFTALIRSFPKNTVPNFLHYPSSDIWQGKLEQLRPGILQFTTQSVWIQWLQVVTLPLQKKNLFKSNLEKKIFSFFRRPLFFLSIFSSTSKNCSWDLDPHCLKIPNKCLILFKYLNFCAKIKIFFFLSIPNSFPVYAFFFVHSEKKNSPKFWINFFPVFISEKSWRCIYVYRPFYRQRTTLFDCKGSCSSLGSGGHGSRST